jgi:hypothetical protein
MAESYVARLLSRLRVKDRLAGLDESYNVLFDESWTTHGISRDRLKGRRLMGLPAYK